jgi:hypothetical protein
MKRATREAARLAKKYRGQIEAKGGVVVLYGTDHAGWMNELRDPQHWTPGCVAVDDTGGQWLAQGGNAQSGAVRWVPLLAVV